MDLETTITYLLLGSNLGERGQYLDRAIQLIGARIGTIGAKSAVYETAAWGKTDQPSFLNIAVAVSTNLNPIELLDTVLAIEQSLGRVREEKWGSRLIDVDIILYGNEVINIPDRLQIPHPEMQHRKFVLEPLVELAPLFIHPVLHKSLTAILADLNDPLSVKKQ